jgi:serine acetyltransferase
MTGGPDGGHSHQAQAVIHLAVTVGQEVVLYQSTVVVNLGMAKGRSAPQIDLHVSQTSTL